MQTGIINSRWFSFTRSGRMDAEFWLRVKQAIADRNIDESNLEAVRKVVRETEEQEQ